MSTRTHRIIKRTIVGLGMFLILTALVGAATGVGQDPWAGGTSWSSTSGNSWTAVAA